MGVECLPQILTARGWLRLPRIIKTGGDSGAATSVGPSEDGQATSTHQDGTSAAGRGPNDAKGTHHVQGQSSAHGSGVLQGEGPEGIRAREGNGNGLQAMSHGQAGSSEVLKMESRDSDAELLQGAAVAEAAAGVGDHEEGVVGSSGELLCTTCRI